MSQLSQTGDNHRIRPGMLIVCKNTGQKWTVKEQKTDVLPDLDTLNTAFGLQSSVSDDDIIHF